jgi:hypothetical protein
MTLRVSGGAEERHSHSTLGSAVGVWSALVDIDIETTLGVYTGAACYKFLPSASGTSQTTAAGVSKAWWSHTIYFTLWGDGTYRCIWDILVPGTARYVGLKKGSSTSYAKIGLWSNATGTVLAESSEFLYGAIQLIKWECDGGNWTFWGNLDGGGWAELFTYDDTGNFTTFKGRLDPIVTSDEGKGASYVVPYVDDIHLWDDQGDNWNSRIGTMGDFPRVSVAHMPNTAGAKTESDAGQAAKLDEIPPDNVDFATINESTYWTNVDDLNKTAGQGPSAGEKIQAIIVTQAGYNAPTQAELEKVNLHDGSTEYLDSEEGIVQIGYTSHAAQTDVTWAGYYPWTPDGASPANENWTETLFEAYGYGSGLVSGKSDQITVQVIFFGSSHEWTVAVVTHVRQGVALGSANAMTF